jgi:hypothetical protein
VQISRRRSRWVLDPHLALSRNGPVVARLLGPFAEQWVGPEFFNVLDTAPLYEEEPELLMWPGTDAAELAAVPEDFRPGRDCVKTRAIAYRGLATRCAKARCPTPWMTRSSPTGRPPRARSTFAYQGVPRRAVHWLPRPVTRRHFALFSRHRGCWHAAPAINHP